MPSLGDVFDQLKQINSNLGLIHSDLGLVTGRLDDIHKTEKDILGVASHVSGQVDVLVGLAQTADQILLYLTEQNKTLICIGEHVSKNTCSMLSEATVQTALQRSIEDGVAAVVELYKTAHADAALSLARARATEQRLLACCPPEPTPPACSYEPCRSPGPINLPTPREPIR